MSKVISHVFELRRQSLPGGQGVGLKVPLGPALVLKLSTGPTVNHPVSISSGVAGKGP